MRNFSPAESSLCICYGITPRRKILSLFLRAHLRSHDWLFHLSALHHRDRQTRRRASAWPSAPPPSRGLAAIIASMATSMSPVSVTWRMPRASTMDCSGSPPWLQTMSSRSLAIFSEMVSSGDHLHDGGIVGGRAHCGTLVIDRL